MKNTHTLYRTYVAAFSVALGAASVATVVTTSSAFAKPPVAKPVAAAKPTSLPSGASIMDRFVQVTGGAAWGKVNTVVMKATLSMPAQGVNGTVDIQAKAPNKVYTKTVVPGLTEQTQATDGATAWSSDQFTPFRALSGAEKQQLLTTAVLAVRPSGWRTVYPKAQTLGIEKVNGQPAYKVRLTPKTGDPSVQYFDVKTGLQVRTDEIVASPQGKITSQTFLSDYRTVEGVKTAFKMRQLVGPAEVHVTTTEMKINAPIDDALFTPKKQ